MFTPVFGGPRVEAPVPAASYKLQEIFFKATRDNFFAHYENSGHHNKNLNFENNDFAFITNFDHKLGVQDLS